MLHACVILGTKPAALGKDYKFSIFTVFLIKIIPPSFREYFPLFQFGFYCYLSMYINSAACLEPCMIHVTLYSR